MGHFRLDVLNESIEKSIVQQERLHTKAQGARARAAAMKQKTKKKESVMHKPEWNVSAAAEIEGSTLHETVQTEISKGAPSTSQLSTKKKVSKTKFKRAAAKSGEGGFHYSPIKTPPQAGATKKPVVIFTVIEFY